MRITKNNKKTLYEFDKLFVEKKQLDKLVTGVGTPLGIYNEKGLREIAKSLFALFSCVPSFEMNFPVRLCPRKEILMILAQEGIGAYCQSLQELCLALESGFAGDRVVYAAMTLPEDVARLLRDMDARLVAASPGMLGGILPRRVDLACSLHRVRENQITDREPRRAYIGLTRDEVLSAIPRLMEKELELGLAVIQNNIVTDEKHLPHRVSSMLQYAGEISQQTGATLHRICPGEGPGMVYRKNIPDVNMTAIVEKVSSAMLETTFTLSLNMGRRLCEPCGLYVSRVLEILPRDRETLVVDGSARQMDFGAVKFQRHISIAGKEWIEGRHVYDVVGCTPTTRDTITVQHLYPETEIGDLLVIHDVGCSMVCSDIPCFLQKADGSLQLLQHGEE